MPGSHQEIDAVLADVDALADSAVSEILGSAGDPSSAEEIFVGGTRAAVMEPPAGTATPTQKSGISPIAAGREDVARVLKLQVPVIVQLARRTVSLSDILDLTTGSIIEFDKPADGELDLLINNKCIGRGQAVKVGENFGLRVTRVGSLRTRIKALGGQPSS